MLRMSGWRVVSLPVEKLRALALGGDSEDAIDFIHEQILLQVQD
jgi:hypothetical protein